MLLREAEVCAKLDTETGGAMSIRQIRNDWRRPSQRSEANYEAEEEWRFERADLPF